MIISGIVALGRNNHLLVIKSLFLRTIGVWGERLVAELIEMLTLVSPFPVFPCLLSSV